MTFSVPFKRCTLAVVVGLALSAPAASWAAEPFIVKDIRVQGLERVDASTVFATLPIRVGGTYDDATGASAIQALYALGLFRDVTIEAQGHDLVVMVQERPTIGLLNITSSKQFEKKQILAALASMGVETGRPYDKAAEDMAIQEMKRQYQARGFYDVQVTPTVTPVENNRVNVVFDVQEGPMARIREIHFVGNQAIKSSTLKRLMQENTGNWMSWYTKSNRYTEEKLNADVETIRQFYLNKGYLEFQVNSAQAALTPDKKAIAITIDVTEGPKYAVSSVSLAGNYLDKDDEFKSLITIKPGEAYKVDDVADTIRALTSRFGKYGYAFAKVVAQPTLDRERQQVALTLVASPDQRAYVRRINVSGNTKTRDEVIRREFRQFESSWFNAEKIQLSKARIDRLGYFVDSSIDTQPVPGTTDLADLEVSVKERPTGSIQVGVGYSSSDGATVTFGISQDNIFGSGQSLGLDTSIGKYNRTVSISSTDPYFTADGVSRTFGVTYSMVKPTASQGSSIFDYGMRQLTANASFGIPLSESNTIYLGAGFEQYKMTRGKDASIAEKLPAQYNYYINSPEGLKGKPSAYGIPLMLGWARDTRDSAISPTRGTYQRVNLALSPLGDMRYFLGTYRFQYFYPLTRQFTFAFNTDIGYGKGLQGRLFPAYKGMYSGGLGSVRGFEDSSLGMQLVNAGTVYSSGGNRKFNVNLELGMPFPGAANDRSLRLFGFVDAGQVYAENTAFSRAWYAAPINANAKKIRSSYGVGIRWISPMGPLSLAFGFPIKKYEGDKTQKIQFQIGTTF